MKKVVKIIIALFKTVFVLGLIGVFIYQLFTKPIKESNNVVSLISLKTKPSDTIRDSKEQLHAQKEVVQISTWGLAEALYKAEIDSLRAELELSKKDKVSSLGIVTIKTKEEFIPTVKADTSTRFVTLAYKTKWVDLSLTSDTSKKSYVEYKDSLVFAVVEESKGWFRRPKTYVDVKSANPNVTHIGVNYFEVKTKPSHWGIGIGVGPGMSLNSVSKGGYNYSWFTVNAGVQYRF